MTLTELISKALTAEKNDSKNMYWTALEVLAASETTDKQRDAAVKKLAKAAEQLKADEHQIDDDLQLVKLRNAAPDLDAMQRDTVAEAAQLSAQAAELGTEAAAAMARATQLQQQAEAVRHRIGVAKNAVNRAKQEAAKLRHKLTQRDHPGALIEVQVERQQHELSTAKNAVQKAKIELSEALAVHEQLLKDREIQRSLDRTRKDDPMPPPRSTEHVESRQRDLAAAERKLRELESQIEAEAV